MAYQRGFISYALAALLIGLVGGFSSVLDPAFVQDMGLAYNNTTRTAPASIHFLAIGEILCVVLGMITVLFLPNPKGESQCD